MYLAFQNVHGASNLPDLTLQAPKAAVEQYATTKLDTYKVAGAMITELDTGVSVVVHALEQAGLLPNAVVVSRNLCAEIGLNEASAISCVLESVY